MLSFRTLGFAACGLRETKRGQEETTMRTVTLILICLMGVSPALAERISDDTGGLIDTYVQKFSRMRDTGERIVVDGRCLSACTLVLSLVPHERICVTQNAVFGFHSAWSYDAQGGEALDQKATRALWDMYPQPIQQWIRANGGLHQKLIYLRGRQLAAFYPICSPGLDHGGQPERAQAATRRVRHAERATHASSAMRATIRRDHATASVSSGAHDLPR
jgi:hypothetical protein